MGDAGGRVCSPMFFDGYSGTLPSIAESVREVESSLGDEQSEFNCASEFNYSELDGPEPAGGGNRPGAMLF